jgi:AraC-like DNA-binding protein
VVSVVEGGVQRFRRNRDQHTTPPLGIIVLNPSEPHTGEGATPAGFLYRALYPSVELFAQIAGELAGFCGQMPAFANPRIDDETLARRFVETHRLLVGGTSALHGEERLLATLLTLVARHADRRGALRPVGQEPAAIRTVRAFIDEHFDRDPTLTELAALVGLSPYHLARVFRAAVGLPPHAYLESVRIREAQRLIRAGTPLAEIAYRVGFADQSHFTHRFRRLVGVTPGRFAQGCR